MDMTKFQWTRKPQQYHIDNTKVEIVTAPHTDLWQRTYYHFQNDNAPLLIFLKATIDLTNAVLLCIWTVKTG